jgi:2-hydroxychromene-2-carboxylate isomerase
MTTADWYFDFISPFAYLQFHRLHELAGRVDVRMRPVLLAGLLDHWGQRGPAEIPPKRQFIYAQVRWLARRRDLAFVNPVAHPFNPLRLLRLTLHLGVTRDVVERLFAFVWQEGSIPEDEAAWRALVASLAVADADAAISRPEIKQALRTNTEAAIAAGVFGVPTLVIDGRPFWGDDATQMALDYLREPEPFIRDAEQIGDLPMAAVRPAGKR